MGATLPLLARHAVRSERQVGSRVGVLYAVNTAGAIAGTVCAAFWLIPELGLRQSVWIGAALNGAVFALAALIARGEPLPSASGSTRSAAVAQGAAWILPAIALSGSVSFAYEVLWTRLLGHVLGGSLQAFATMLASFLLGIALGSAAATRWATTRERALAGFSIAQLGIAFTSYGAFALADQLPHLAARLGAGLDSPLASAALAVAALLPITLCIGVTFPFAVRFLALDADQAAAVTARVYAWNTLGAIAGALGAGFVLLPGLGFEGTALLGVAVSLLLALGSALVATPVRKGIAAVAAATGLLLAVAPPRAPWSLLRQSPLQDADTRGEIVFSAVGRSSTVLVVAQPLQFRLWTNGLPESVIDRIGTLPQPDAISHWLGLLPALIRPEARELLVIGLGGGAVLESVPSSVAAVDVIELEQEVLAANRAIASDRARDPLADPRFRVHIGDARGVLKLSAKRYDAIVSQPSHPWTAGASHLYTREFFSLVRSRLQPDGVFVQWIGLTFVDEALLRSLLATLDDVFGHVEVYAPTDRALLFAASPAPVAGLAGAGRALRAAPRDFARFGVVRVEDFASAWLLDEQGARAIAHGAPLNTDDDNRLAARSTRLGRSWLEPAFVRALLSPHDPLLADSGDLDRAALLRKIVLRGGASRARELAMAEDGADEELGLGWVELTNNRSRRAARHFARARALAPDASDALVGLVASRRADLARGAVSEVPEARLEPPVAALVEGWRLAEKGDWDGVAALDAELARIAPGHALFREASQLRTRWRVKTGDPAACAEGMAIMERRLEYFWHPEDALLHARAALLAGQPIAASASLERIAALASRNERGRDQARRALEIAKALPEDSSVGLRERLAARVGGAGPR
jgi:predicted membrane-bound spermidine synthase